MNVLIVDDSKAVQAYTRGLLSAQGWTIDSAFDGRAGLAAMIADPQRYGVVLLDWEMPLMTGPETLVAARAAGVATPIVMMTTKSEIADIREAMGKGADDYIMKPFTLDIMLEKMTRVRLRKGA